MRADFETDRDAQEDQQQRQEGADEPPEEVVALVDRSREEEVEGSVLEVLLNGAAVVALANFVTGRRAAWTR